MWLLFISSSGSSSIDTIKPWPATPLLPTSSLVLLCWLVGGSCPSVCFVVWEWSAWHVDSLGCVILEERLHEHAHCAEHTHKHKDPQEEAVDHHGNIFPVLAHLWMGEGWGEQKGFGTGWRERLRWAESHSLKHPLILSLSVPPPLCSGLMEVKG